MFTTLIAFGVVLLQITILLIIFFLIKKSPLIKKVSQFSHVLIATLFIGAALGSLIYEFLFGFEPCLLCWYQRIAIFGVAILSLTGDVRKSPLLQKQILIFSILGLAVALLHNYIDIFPGSADICGAGPSCLKRYVYAFGYITIPMMSLTVLLAGSIISFIAMRFPQPSFKETEKGV